jgi:F-type H+-transporting ATPase subunit delta
MKDRKLATRYARALLSAISDPQAAAKADSFLQSLAQAMNASVELRLALLNPAIPASTRKRALNALAEQAQAGPLVAKFLAMVVDHRRVTGLPAIAATFHELREAAEGVVPATVTTAKPIDQALQARVESSLARLTGKRVRTTWRVDESLVGGVVTRVGSKVYDGSVKTQLMGLRRKMAEE